VGLELRVMAKNILFFMASILKNNPYLGSSYSYRGFEALPYAICVGNRKRMKNTFSTYAKNLTNYGTEVPQYLGSLTKIGTTFGIPLRTEEHLLQKPHYQ